jgi:DNA polymerase-1
MRTISGDIYNTRTGKMITVTEEEADYNHLMQTLTGDAVDNYIGCPGIGKVNAKKILDAADDKWAAIVKAYEKAGLTEEDALIQARCARILRHTDYDLEKKEVILWSP